MFIFFSVSYLPELIVSFCFDFHFFNSLFYYFFYSLFSYIKEESIEHVLSKLNGYHDNIECTYEIENDGKLHGNK